jgi:hypothetical protein
MTAANGQAAADNARKFTSYDTGMCLKFVRGEAWRIGSLYGSAIEAWNGARFKHKGDRHPPIGAPCFYSGGKYGHIVVWMGGDKMRSTDCTSAYDVSNADIDWPVRAWGDTYLGWTEDLNGVRLPLGDDDEMTEDDWERMEDMIRRVVWEEHMTVTQPSGDDQSKAREQVVRETYQTVKRL